MTEKNSNGSVGIIIGVAIACLLGVVLVGIIAEQAQDKTVLASTTETIDISGALVKNLTVVVNRTHGTTFRNDVIGTFILPTVSENTGHNLSCTQPIITNASSGDVIAVGNWTWSTAAAARGRCGITITGNISEPYNNSLWNFSYSVLYYNINPSTQFTVSHAPTGWQAADCPLSNGVLRNGTGDTALTDGTDYFMDETTGVFTLRPTLIVNQTQGNNFEGSYSYCGDDYINSSWQRTILNMVPGFFALAILLGAAFVIYFILRREGIELF